MSRHLSSCRRPVQSYLPQGPDLVDNIDNFTIAHAHATFDVNNLVVFLLDVRQHLLDLFLNLILADLFLAKVVLAIIGNSDYNRVVLDDSLVFLRVLRSFGRFTVTPCCNKGVTTMKMIKSTNMMSTIGVTFISD